LPFGAHVRLRGVDAPELDPFDHRKHRHDYPGGAHDDADGWGASGLSLITAAIVHWNTIYLDRAVRQLRALGATIPDVSNVAPLGWEHIGLTGDYVWGTSDRDAPFRPLRDIRATFPPLAA
jgi:hypothetical protein